MADMNEARASAAAKKDAAKQKIEATRRDIANRKLLKANPVPK